MKRAIYLTLTVFLSLFIITSCQDDVSNSLKGTTWEHSVSGKEALEWVDYPASAKASITYTLTIQFTTETDFRISDRIKGTAYGEQVNEILESEVGTYIYNSKEKKITFCLDDCFDGKIKKNKLTISGEGVEPVVLTKK